MAAEMYEFVYHDGMHIHVSKMIEMAKNAGSYNVAEHYIVSLLVHANRYHLKHIIDDVDNIRKHYNLAPFPKSDGPASGNNMPDFETPQSKQTDLAMTYYAKMTQEQREAVLKEALAQLRAENEEIFAKKACWIGIYLVVRDRLDENLKMQVFCKFDLTPNGWPTTLAIGTKSLSNIRRYIKGKDQFKAYYLMDDNPFKDLCDKFWGILLGLILTKRSG